VPAGVLAQVWRGNSPVVARLLRGCEVELLDEDSAKRAGELLGKSRTADVIDGVVALGAHRRGDAIVTSDADDIRRLLEALRSRSRIVPVGTADGGR
jgi:predicted nucleic acid-binding protein